MELEKELNKQDLDDLELMIVSILSDVPVSVDTIRHLTGIPSFKIIKRLNKLAKWSIVRKATKREVTFWVRDTI